MLQVVEPVTGAVVDTDFIDTLSDRLGITKVTGFCHTADSGIDTHDGGSILQLGEPAREGHALNDFKHEPSVVHGLHLNNTNSPAMSSRLVLALLVDTPRSRTGGKALHVWN